MADVDCVCVDVVLCIGVVVICVMSVVSGYVYIECEGYIRCLFLRRVGVLVCVLCVSLWGCMRVGE